MEFTELEEDELEDELEQDNEEDNYVKNNLNNVYNEEYNILSDEELYSDIDSFGSQLEEEIYII